MAKRRQDVHISRLVDNVIDDTSVIEADETILVSLSDRYSNLSRAEALLGACVPYALGLGDIEGWDAIFFDDCGKFVMEAAYFFTIHGYDEQHETLFKVLEGGWV